MNSLPIVLREMRVTARKSWIYRTRLGMALAAIAAWIFIFLAAPPRVTASEKGMVLLVTLSVIAMVLALLSGVFLTADCLSEEKREGTLGLLFLTTLKGYDIVIGKMVANGATAFFALLSILPILCLPLLTGGVTWAETLRVMLVLILSLALSLSLGMLVSARAVESRAAFVATLLGLFLLAGVPLLAEALQGVFLRRTAPDNLFFQFSPIYALRFAFDVHYDRYTTGCYWKSVSLLGLMVLGLLTVACRMVRYSWQSRETTPAKVRTKLGIFRRRRPERRRPRLPGLVQRGADIYAWLSYQGSDLGTGTRAFFVVLTIIWLLLLAASGTTRRQGQMAFTFAFFVAFVMHLVMKSVFALESTRQIHQDIRSGNMELLLATPLRDTEIIAGQIQAFRKRFFWPVIFLTAINASLELAIFLFYNHLDMQSVAKVFSTFFLGGMLVLYTDYLAIQWVGIWKSLQAKTHLKATFDTLKGVLGLPWIVAPMLFGIAIHSRGPRTQDVLLTLMVFWYIFSLCLDLYLIAQTKQRLRTHFRDLAANRGL